MPTFVDESGDPGVTAGASAIFYLAAVFCETVRDAEACRAGIADVRKQVLRKPDRFEFKASMGRPDVHDKFFAAAARLPFHFVVCAVDKGRLPDDSRTPGGVIGQAVGGLVRVLHEPYLIAEAFKGTPLNERVLVDRHTDRHGYLAAVQAGFESLKSPRAPGAALVKSVKTGRSDAEDLIQLADIVCGAVRRCQAAGDRRHFNLIAGGKRFWRVVGVDDASERETGAV